MQMQPLYAAYDHNGQNAAAGSADELLEAIRSWFDEDANSIGQTTEVLDQLEAEMQKSISDLGEIEKFLGIEIVPSATPTTAEFQGLLELMTGDYAKRDTEELQRINRRYSTGRDNEVFLAAWIAARSALISRGAL